MTQEQLETILAQVEEGIQAALTEEARLRFALEESDREYQESVDRLRKVGL